MLNVAGRDGYRERGGAAPCAPEVVAVHRKRGFASGLGLEGLPGWWRKDRQCPRPVRGTMAGPQGRADTGIIPWDHQLARRGAGCGLQLSGTRRTVATGTPDALVLEPGAAIRLGWLALPQTASRMSPAAESHPHPPRAWEWCQGSGQLLQMSFYLFNLPYHRPSSQAPASGDSGLPAGKVGSGVASWQKECFGVGPAWVQIPAEAFQGETSALSPPGHRQ